MKLENVILRDLRANQPLATLVPTGTLYFVTDELVTERSNGTIWQSYSGGGNAITALTGDVTASGPGSVAATIAASAVTTSKINNAAATYAKIQNVSATARILGRKTAGAGSIEECTLSDILDFLGSAAQGDILFRDSGGWSYLAPGTNGNFLKTQGAAANPVWAAASASPAWQLAATSSPSGVTHVDFTGLAGFTDIRVFVKAVPMASSGAIVVTISTDNGSTFLSSSGDYIGINGSGIETNQSNLALMESTTTSARSGEVTIEGCQLAAPKPARSNYFSNDSQLLRYVVTTSAINAVRVGSIGNVINMTGGTIYVFAR